MECVPQIRIGNLQFRSAKETLISQLGPSSAHYDHGDGRVSWDFGDNLTTLVLDGVGLVCVTLYQGPVYLWGHNLFELEPTQLQALLASRQLVVTTCSEIEESIWISALELGLHVTFIEDQRFPEAVEVFIGTWWQGRAENL